MEESFFAGFGKGRRQKGLKKRAVSLRKTAKMFEPKPRAFWEMAKHDINFVIKMLESEEEWHRGFGKLQNAEECRDNINALRRIAIRMEDRRATREDYQEFRRIIKDNLLPGERNSFSPFVWQRAPLKEYYALFRRLEQSRKQLAVSGRKLAKKLEKSG